MRKIPFSSKTMANLFSSQDSLRNINKLCGAFTQQVNSLVMKTYQMTKTVVLPASKAPCNLSTTKIKT